MQKKKITPTFNFVLFMVIFSIMSVDQYSKASAESGNTWIEYLPYWNDFLIIQFKYIVFIAIVPILGGMLLRVFWNSLISDVFALRELNFQETLSITLIWIIFVL